MRTAILCLLVVLTILLLAGSAALTIVQRGYSEVAFGCYLLGLTSLVAAALVWKGMTPRPRSRRGRRRKRRRGLCPRCHYQMGDVARCPECGAYEWECVAPLLRSLQPVDAKRADPARAPDSTWARCPQCGAALGGRLHKVCNECGWKQAPGAAAPSGEPGS